MIFDFGVVEYCLSCIINIVFDVVRGCIFGGCGVIWYGGIDVGGNYFSDFGMGVIICGSCL